MTGRNNRYNQIGGEANQQQQQQHHQQLQGTNFDDAMMAGGDFLAGFGLADIPSPRMHQNMRPGGTNGGGTSDGNQAGRYIQDQMMLNGGNPAETEMQEANAVNQLRIDIHQLNYRLTNMERTVYHQLQSQMPQAMPPGLQVMPPAAAPSAEYREPKMRDLDGVCLPNFAIQPQPSVVELNRMARTLLQRFPSYGQRNLVASIRKWYRKKRDENGQKVFTACISQLQPLIDGGAGIEEVRMGLTEDGAFRAALLAEANLDIEDAENASLFLTQKVEAYFNRRVLPNAQ